jgi:GcrA cell cycle regulator
MSSWPATHEAMLRQHFNAGLAYSAIASELNREFGTAYSRNACIGRGHRIGLVSRRVVHAPVPKPKRKPATKEGAQRPDIAIRKAATAPKIAAPYKPKPDPIKPGEVQLIELTADTCRWPSGDRPEDVRYCGLQPVDGSPYCERHCRLAYRNAQ